MIQFNLLPDVKLEFIRAQRIKRSIMTISIIAGVVSLGILILMFTVVNVIQKTHLSNLNNNIEDLSGQIQSNEEINKILTVQNQLNNLTSVHETKPEVSRLQSYLTQIRPGDPAEVSFGSMELDFSENKLILSGSADSFKSINALADTLKFTNYTIDGEEVGPAFNNVVLADFEANDTEDEEKKAANYSISMFFEPALFDISQDVKLAVPNQVTTRSVIGRPLFEKLPETNDEGEQEGAQ